MSIYVILGTPGAFDFEAFGESTRKTLALLAPLVALERRKTLNTEETLVQVREFARAIRLGVEAAQRGFTAAEDILTLTRLVHSTTQAERTEYLVGTLHLADQAYARAQEAFQVFRDVRKKIFSLTEKFNAASKNTSRAVPSQSSTPSIEDPAQRSIDELGKSIEVLEEFAKQISAMVQWWDWVKIETRGNPDPRSQTISFDDSSLKQKSVVDRWKLLRTQFADYTNMVGQLEDSYPELLSPPPIPRRDRKAPPKPRVPKKISYHRADIQNALRVDSRSQRSPTARQRSADCGCIIL